MKRELTNVACDIYHSRLKNRPPGSERERKKLTKRRNQRANTSSEQGLLEVSKIPKRPSHQQSNKDKNL
jgi:hypothetical protein